MVSGNYRRLPGKLLKVTGIPVDLRRIIESISGAFEVSQEFQGIFPKGFGEFRVLQGSLERFKRFKRI